MAKPKNDIESVKQLKRRDSMFHEPVKRRIIGSFSLNNYKSEVSPKVDNFLKDIIKVYDKHGMSLSHEDGQGGFLVEKYDDSYVRWLWAAQDKTHLG